ncbi:hypothetical protein [Vulcanisaeta sp. JCM 16159]|uniref:hypothetical protein n=1 Tax=Vulcanisaeta sp. JCM 16159 TaxID=1295371 RepID=UPI001FB566F2|nr:hypothetical protein [Vulcanisaeta sp. JCM 16159]
MWGAVGTIDPSTGNRRLGVPTWVAMWTIDQAKTQGRRRVGEEGWGGRCMGN